jgi:CheY-like chemotaxis protein
MKHALVIEDRFLIAMMIEERLLAAGWDSVIVAASQEAAIQSAQELCPDLITADDSLENGSGIEAIRHICRDKSIPVVFIVADATRIQAAVPDATVLLKPFSEEAFASALTAASPPVFSTN